MFGSRRSLLERRKLVYDIFHSNSSNDNAILSTKGTEYVAYNNKNIDEGIKIYTQLV